MESNSYNHFRNRYSIIKFIGDGHFGEVFKVIDNAQNIIKAEKKSIQPIKSEDKQKILEQLELLIKLNHHYIIKGYDYIVEKKTYDLDDTITQQYLHIIMEYFKGKQLEDYLGKLTQAQVIKIYKQIKSAILYLKKQNIVHRDLSLDNILVDENLNIKITDFGISSDLKGEKYKQTEGRGRYLYKAPEISNAKVSMNSDLWALGIIVLELYFGVRINLLYDGYPGIREEFPNKFYEINKGNISQDIMRIVEPLLQRDHNTRKFYDGDKIEDESDEEVEDQVIVLKHIKTNILITKKMIRLWLNSENIRTEGAFEIAKNLKYLRQLWLNNNNIRTEGVIQIAKNLKKLNKLWLNNNNVQKEGAVEISKNLTDLVELRLNYNNIGTEGALEIARNLKNLEQLQLDNNNIRTAGAIQIAKNLKKLTKLRLNGNNIETAGAIEIANNLNKLVQLSLENNLIGIEGGVKIGSNLNSLRWL